jgi:hypothetical protein
LIDDASSEAAAKVMNKPAMEGTAKPFAKSLITHPLMTWLGANAVGWPRLYELSNSVPSISVPA